MDFLCLVDGNFWKLAKCSTTVVALVAVSDISTLHSDPELRRKEIING